MPDQRLHDLHAAGAVRRRGLPHLWREGASPLRSTPRHTEIGETLAGHGRVVRLTTRGRVTGRAVSTAVGFIEEPDGSLLVAAGSDDADWALNLLADPHAVASRAGDERPYEAEPLHGADFEDAIRSLILRYGTPSEGLGSGPAFRLRPTDDPASAGERDPARPTPDLPDRLDSRPTT